MAANKFDELLALDISSRLALIAQLCDSIVDDDRALPTSEEERELLTRRSKEDDEDPDAAIPWELARAELLRPR